MTNFASGGSLSGAMTNHPAGHTRALGSKRKSPPEQRSRGLCWRGRRGSNPQPPDRQSGTLPIELRPHAVGGRGSYLSQGGLQAILWRNSGVGGWLERRGGAKKIGRRAHTPAGRSHSSLSRFEGTARVCPCGPCDQKSLRRDPRLDADFPRSMPAAHDLFDAPGKPGIETRPGGARFNRISNLSALG